MKISTLFKAAALGLALTASMVPVTGQAENLKVLRDTTASSLAVPMNRAVVVESETPFAEVSIANPAIADLSTLTDRTIYVLGKEPGRTTLTLLAADGSLIANVDVRVERDVAEFKERLGQILPNEPIEVRTANDGIVLSGTVSSIVRMQRALDLAERYAPERVSNLMTVGGAQQVMLKVRFAEMQREVSKNLSSNLGITGSSDGGGSFTASGITGNADNPGSFNLGFNAGNIEFDLLIEALESKGVVRTLAEPNLIAMSGQEATFLAGGEYPVPIAQTNGTTTIEFKPFGVELNFVPTVTEGDIINLQLATSVSSIDASNGIEIDGFEIDAFRTRRSSTTVQMRDGESFAVAGLLQDDFTNLNSQVPWLGDIPVLGALFRSAEYERSQSELVIIVTPHLVSPTRGEALALPTDRIRLPSEAELFMFGKVAGQNRKFDGVAGEVAKQDFGGSYGYVLE